MNNKQMENVRLDLKVSIGECIFLRFSEYQKDYKIRAKKPNPTLTMGNNVKRKVILKCRLHKELTLAES